MKKKRLMLLGGIRYLLPIIETAQKMGYYVITADYLPENIAHRFSDEYVNVSIVDKEAVLKVAKEKRINGIMSFGVDPGVVSASYVQEQMGLPAFGPFESVCILQNKDRFRAFLAENGFNVPKAKGFATVGEALSDLSWYKYPMIVKPTDSAGSKGVTRVDEESQLRSALEFAFQNSISGHVIVEEFIEKQGCSSDTDCMSIDGKLVFVSFNAQRFDQDAANPYTPAAYTWPSTFTKEQEAYLTQEIQRVISLLGLKTAVYNVETRVGIDGKPYIMELTPRGGGNRLCEMLQYATGVNLIKAITRAVVGDSAGEIGQKPYNGYWAEIILHSDRDGVFQDLDISKDFRGEIIEKDLWVNQGDRVNCFMGANNTIGTLVLSFKDKETMETAIETQKDWLKVNVQ